ncbi:MAG: ShlB/FhaC/HecB family hemolysin secretion/activation protein [Brevundimonas sp.]
MAFRNRWTWLAAAMVMMGGVAHAQQPPVDPGRLDERFRQQPEAPDVRAVDVPELPRQESAPESDLSVTLTDVRFEGAQAVPVAALEALAAPYLGRPMPLAGVFALAEAVTAEYRSRGYVLSRAVVGPQRIEDGVLTIQVLEGYVDRITIEGDAGGYAPFLTRYMDPVRDGRPTSGDALARALLLARDLGGVDVRAVVSPSATQQGAADISLVVERDPFEAFVAVDNRGSRWLGPIQVYGGVTLNDMLGMGERLSLTAVSAPEDSELGFVSASYDQPLGWSGLRFNAFASYANTEPGDELALLGLTGESTTWGMGFQYPFLRSRETNVLGRLTFTARDADSGNDFIDPVFEDSIRTLSAEVMANHADRWGGLSSLRASATRGINIFDATRMGDPNKSRATASGEFTRFNIELSRIQPVTGGLYLRAGVVAQVTDDSLLASEEFGLGGTQYGRAYDPSEITGDEGVAGKVELFYTLPPQGFATLEPYAFYEGGEVSQNDPLPGEPRRASLESAGVGVRLGFNDRFGASIEYAVPLGRDVAAEGNDDGRFFFTLSAAF